MRRLEESQREPRLLSQSSLTSPLCVCFSNRGRSVQWTGTPLPDWVHAERSTVEGLSQWALFWWVHPLFVLSSGCQVVLRQSERLCVVYCPLLVSPMLYHTVMTGLETDDRWQFIFLNHNYSISPSHGFTVVFVLLCVFVFYVFGQIFASYFPVLFCFSLKMYSHKSCVCVRSGLSLTISKYFHHPLLMLVIIFFSVQPLNYEKHRECKHKAHTRRVTNNNGDIQVNATSIPFCILLCMNKALFNKNVFSHIVSFILSAPNNVWQAV